MCFIAHVDLRAYLLCDVVSLPKNVFWALKKKDEGRRFLIWNAEYIYVRSGMTSLKGVNLK